MISNFFFYFFFFSSRRRHTRWNCDWSSDVCSSDLLLVSQYKPTMAPAALIPKATVLRAPGRSRGVKVPRSEERRVGKSVDLGGRRIIKKKKEEDKKV